MIYILLRQIVIMALMVAIGYILCARRILSEQGINDLGSMLISFIIPCVIVKSCITEFSTEKFRALGISALLALIGYIIAMGISWLIYRRKEPLENFAAAFCNAGFIGIPLVQAAVGEEGVFYIAASIAFLNFFQWTWGVYLLTGDKKSISPEKILKNPVLIASVIGLLLFVSDFPVPEIITTTLGYITDLNVPFAMFLLGAYMVKIPFSKIFSTAAAYRTALFRLLLIPIIFMIILRCIPSVNLNIKLAVFLAAATPTGANICVFAKKNNCDYEFSVICVCLSTILCVLTIPILAQTAQWFLG